ncbi:MAG: arginyltransferase [Gammaproteobacteria bacterium]|nr:arginyltransferase [Gammaproteobacteria bacterium]
MTQEAKTEPLKFYATPPHACSYLPQETAVTAFVDPEARLTPGLYSALALHGFRRSGEHIYRPHCGSCQACIPVRIPVADFLAQSLSRRFRRINAANADLDVRIRMAEFNPEHYALYARYVSLRHHDGDMYPPSETQYRNFLLSSWADTEFVEFRLAGRLLAVAVTDIMNNGLSALYTFYEPDEEARSLGTYAVLWQIDETMRRRLPHLYLGYYIRQCRKMSYKRHYRPQELLVNGQWTLLR